MTKKLFKNYKKFAGLKRKQLSLKRFFNAFLKEAVYRSTKMEHPMVSRKDIFSLIK